MLTAGVDCESGLGSLGKAEKVNAVQAYPWRLSKQTQKTPYGLSLVLSSVYRELIWHGHSSWLFMVCGGYVGLFPVQTERKKVWVNPCFMGAFRLAHLAKAMWRTSPGERSSFPVSLLQLSQGLWSTASPYSSPLLNAFRLLFRQHYLQLSLAVHQ